MNSPVKKDRRLQITIQCIDCGEKNIILVAEEDYVHWRAGKAAWRVFRYLALHEVGLLMRRLCGLCIVSWYPTEVPSGGSNGQAKAARVSRPS